MIQTAARTDPIPCQLAATSCRNAVGGGGLTACIDDIYRFDATCRTDETERDDDAFNLTAQPPPVEIRKVCSLETDPSRNKCVNGSNVGSACATDGDCPGGVCGVCRVPDGLRPTVPVAQDKAGRLTGVASAQGALVVVDGESFPWLVQGGTAFDGAPLQPVASQARDVNYSLLNPIFFGVPDPDRPGVTIATVDAPFALEQSTRFACSEDPTRACTKSSAGCMCTVDSLAPLPSPLPGYASGVGPTLLNVPLESPDGPPLVQLLGMVTIDALFAAEAAGSGDTAFAAPVSECLAETLPDDLASADPDSQDVLMTLINTRTGRRQPLAGGVARATTRVVDREPFSLPTHATEGPLLAFLEDEFHACDFGAGDTRACDLDGDGLPFGHAVRVFDVTLPGVDRSPVTPGGYLIGVAPDRHVNRAAVAVSEGLVFARAPASIGPRSLAAVAAPEESREGSVSADGAFVAYAAPNPMTTAYTSQSGSTVEVVTGPNGEIGQLDASGDTVITYRIEGKGVDDPSAKCRKVRAVSNVLLAIPKTCRAAFAVVDTQPGASLLLDGDSSTGFGEGDPDTDVLKWTESVSWAPRRSPSPSTARSASARSPSRSRSARTPNRVSSRGRVARQTTTRSSSKAPAQADPS